MPDLDQIPRTEASKTSQHHSPMLIISIICAVIALLLSSTVLIGNAIKARNSNGFVNIAEQGAKPNDPSFDNAPIINKIIRNMPKQGGGIFIPAGTWHLHSSVNIDRSYITIAGVAGSARSAIDPADGHTQAGGGGSLLQAHDGVVAIQAKIATPGVRISGLTLRDFGIKGTSNNSVGIDVQSDSDRVVIDNMMITNIGVGVRLKGADAPRISNSWIAETKSSIELTGASQQAMVTNNSLGAQPQGVTLMMENPGRYLISGNTIYPDGESNIRLFNPVHGTITGNTISSYYPGVLEMLANDQGTVGNGNVVSGNMISVEQFKGKLTGAKRTPDWGIVHLETYSSVVSGNTIIADSMPEGYTGVNLVAGNENRITNNIIGYNNPSPNEIVIAKDVTGTVITRSSVGRGAIANHSAEQPTVE